MAFQFPAAPTLGQVFTPLAGVSYTYDGTGWVLAGAPGPTGPQGPAGVDGSGVPNGGTTGQVLTKNSATNQDTGWSTPSAGGGGATGVNLFINGRVQVDQRGVGTALDIAGVKDFGPDRWGGSRSGTGYFTLQREADALYPGDYRLKASPGTTDTTIGAAEFYFIFQRIEGVHCQELYYGSANAQPITIAFEVESTITGTFPVAIQNSAKNRSYVTTFTVNAANTREVKTITIPGDTTGTWLTALNTIGLQFSIGLALGTDFNAPAANAWQTGNYVSLAGTTNFLNAAASIRFKNLRMHKGSTDLGIDKRLFAEDLALCQRYFWKSFSQTVKPAYGVDGNNAISWQLISASLGNQIVTVPLPVPMCLGPSPTLTTYSPTDTAFNINHRNMNTNSDGNGIGLYTAGEGRFLMTTTPAVSGWATAQHIQVHATLSTEL